MKTISGFFKFLVLLAVVAGVAALVVSKYSYIFSKRVSGIVVDVERVTDPSAIVGSRATEEQMYSYSVLIQGEDGHLYTSSSQDRQWQVIKKGYWVEALLFRYPPWQFEKGNIFFNALVEEVKIPPGLTVPPPQTPSGGPSAAPAMPAPPTGQAPAHE